jgi:hypothetical protein
MLFDTSQYLSSSALMAEDNDFDEENFVRRILKIRLEFKRRYFQSINLFFEIRAEQSTDKSSCKLAE